MRKFSSELSDRILSDAIGQVTDMDTCERLLATLLSRQINLEAKLARRRRSSIVAAAMAAAGLDTPSPRQRPPRTDAEVCPLCAGSGRASHLLGSEAGRARLAAATAAAAAASLVAPSGGAAQASSVGPESSVNEEQGRLERLISELRIEREKLEEQVGKLAAAATSSAARTTIGPIQRSPRADSSSHAPSEVVGPATSGSSAAKAAAATTAAATTTTTLLSSSIQRMKRMDTLKRRKMKRREQSSTQQQQTTPSSTFRTNPIANPVVSFRHETALLKRLEQAIDEQPDDEETAAQLAPPSGGPMQTYGRKVRASLASLLGGAASPTHAPRDGSDVVRSTTTKRFSLNPFASVSAAIASSFNSYASPTKRRQQSCAQQVDPSGDCSRNSSFIRSEQSFGRTESGSDSQMSSRAMRKSAAQASRRRAADEDRRSSCSCLRSSPSDQSVKNGQQVSVE